MISVGVAVTLGPADVSLVNVRDVLLNHLGLADIPVKAAKNAIVWEERLPRALVAACAGAGLALCGVVMQSLLRNPLAEPFVLGVSSGASTGAVVIGVLGIGGGVLGLSGGAFVGALVAFGLVLLLSRFTSGGTSGVILAGVASTQFFSAYWAGHKKDATANLELLLDQLSDVADPHRTAQFVSVIALVRPDGGEQTVEGRWPGRLATAPAGPGGFGYDPIFIPDGQPAGEERTVGEWTAAEKNAASHRSRAFRELAPLLETL